MPIIDNEKYPDDIDGITQNHKLMRAFNQYAASLRPTYRALMYQFVQTPPNATGMWDFLNDGTSAARALLLKLATADRKRITRMQQEVAAADIDDKKKDWAVKNWKGWADIRSNAITAWTQELNDKVVPNFYTSKPFQKLHHADMAKRGGPKTEAHATTAVNAIKVTSKQMEALGFTKTKDKKLMGLVNVVAQSAALGQHKMGKGAFATILTVETSDSFKRLYGKYEDLVKALKRKKVFI